MDENTDVWQLISHSDSATNFPQRRVERSHMNDLTLPNVHDNKVAREGYDRCDCGCKYWENDRCVDCGFTLTSIETRDRRELEQEATT